MRGNDKPRPMRDRFDRWIEAYEERHDGKKPNQAKIAKELNIDGSSLSRRINGKTEFSESEIRAVVKFFDISYDEFFSGVTNKNKVAQEAIGLDERALMTLIRINRTDSKLISVLDILLSNEHMADAYLRMFLLYAEVPMLKVSQWNSDDPNDSVLLTSSFGDEIVKAMVVSCFEQTLNDFRREWEKRNYNYPKFVLTKREVKLIKKKHDAELLHRLKSKRIVLNLKETGKPKPIKQYMEVIEKIIMSRLTDVVKAREAGRNREAEKGK